MFILQISFEKDSCCSDKNLELVPRETVNALVWKLEMQT